MARASTLPHGSAVDSALEIRLRHDITSIDRIDYYMYVTEPARDDTADRNLHHAAVPYERRMAAAVIFAARSKTDHSS